MTGLLARWAHRFNESAAPYRARIERGSALSADGFTALLAGQVNCATFARELFPSEVAAYEAHFGVRPRLVPVAGGSFATLHATHAIAIYVNAANPLAHLTMQQLAEVFAAAPNAPTHWGELGLGGRWRLAPIDLFGMTPYRGSGNPPGIVNFLRLQLLHGREFRADVRVAADAREAPLQAIVRRVAADPNGIGYSGFGFAVPGVKTLSIAADGAGQPYAGTPANISSRRYPLVRTLYLLFDPSAKFTPLVNAFAGYALSEPGQALVARDAMHFTELSAAERETARTGWAAPPAPAAARRLTQTLLPYRAAAVRIPPHAGYVTASGAIAIVGYNDMRTPLAAIDALFSAAHPGCRFSLTLEGTRTAPAALMRGTSAIAPMGAPFEDAPLAAYRQRIGADPLMIRVAHAAIDPSARSSPLAVFVQDGNPLAKLTLKQLAAVFAPPAGTHGASRWGDLGLGGVWADRPIDVVGLLPGTALANFLTRQVFAGRPFSKGYTGFGESSAVIAQTLHDPAAIAIADLNQRAPGLKIVPLARCSACSASGGSAADLIAGRYPLDRYLYIYLRRIPGRGIDPLVREYLRLVLSRDGQTAIAASPPHYLPLNAREVDAGLAALR